MKGKLVFGKESCAIKFKHLVEALEFMAYGTDVRVMFQMSFLTGCRLDELDKMEWPALHGNVIYWQTCKNGPMRHEDLNLKFIHELHEYRAKNRVYGKKMFGISSETFRRYFNRDIRPHLSSAWQQRRVGIDVVAGNKREEFVLQLKGLRKNFATLEFAKQYKKWKSAEVALEFASKRMKHSTRHITAFHYLRNFEELDIEYYVNLSPADIIRKANEQKRIMDFF